MALVLADRVKETSGTTGTGDFSLAGATTGFQRFADTVGDGNTTYYAISLVGGGQFEVGRGTYIAATNSITRDEVFDSSNNGSLVSFTTGTKDVFVVYPSGRAVTVDGSTVNIPNSATVPVSGGGTGADSASTARSNLGLGSVATQDANNVNITGGTISGTDVDVSGATFTVADDQISGDAINGGTATPTTLNSTNLNVDSGTLFVDSVNNRVGVGTSSPDTNLEVEGYRPIIELDNTDTGGGTYRVVVGDATEPDYLGIFNANTSSEIARFDSGGILNLFMTGEETGNTNGYQFKSAGGLGGLHVYASGGERDLITLKNNVTSGPNSGNTATIGKDRNTLTFGNNGSEAARIDSSGNLLVGTTSGSEKLTVAGDAEINELTVGRGGGNISSNTSIGVNALSNNITGYKTTAVGEGALSSFTSGKENTAIGHLAGTDVTTGAGNLFLGRNSGRSDSPSGSITTESGIACYGNNGVTNHYMAGDLHLVSGGIYLGGTGSANYLDDYEEGTFTPIYRNVSDTFTVNTGFYKKVGEIVHVEVYTTLSGSASFSGVLFALESLPFRHMNELAPNAVINGSATVDGVFYFLHFEGNNRQRTEFVSENGSQLGTSTLTDSSEIRMAFSFFTQ